MRKAATALATVFAAVCAGTAAAPAAAAAPEIQAHRGGTVSNGTPAFAEESLAAYRHAAANGFVLEVDAKLTKDGVPVAIHDATVDRTTTCTGEVRSFTLAALRACRFDMLGSPGSPLRTRAAKVSGRIATIAEVLELARLTGSRVNLEIKNLPTDPDWDPTPGYANRVMAVVKAVRLSRSQVLIQSFIPANLDVAKQRIPRVRTSVLALAVSDALVTLAKDKGYDYVSPQWPFSAAFVRQAHQAGALVLPYTLDKRADVRAAAKAKVDGLITDDPLMAAGALGLRPARALTAKLSRHLGRIVARGKLRLPPGVSRRRGCSGRITLRVLGAKRALHARRTPLQGDCTFELAVTVPRGAPAELIATVGFAGNAKLLPRLVGPTAVPSEIPRALPHKG
jgi:glycerophosphoryl diester phosphodiesterase